jgi:sortase A
MADKQTVDELSIDELEHLIASRKRESRTKQMRRMQQMGRIIESEQPDTLSGEMSINEKRKIKPKFEGDIDTGKIKQPRKNIGTKRTTWQKITSISLSFVEITIVIGLIFIGVEMFRGIGNLQQETAETQRIAEAKLRELVPTLEPTPQLTLTNVVLPTGHTPPNQVGGGQFNFSEIPAQMRSLVANQVFLPPDIARPLPTNETPLVLRIPKLNIDSSIIQGVDWEALKLGVGQVLNGATPADSDSNIVLGAHNDIYGELFRYLDRLEPGDQIQIQTASNLYNYTITGWDLYEPNEVQVMDPRGKPTATLISCYPYRVNNKRIVVFADLDEAT